MTNTNTTPALAGLSHSVAVLLDDGDAKILTRLAEAAGTTAIALAGELLQLALVHGEILASIEQRHRIDS